MNNIPIHRRTFIRNAAVTAGAFGLSGQALHAMTFENPKAASNRVGLYSITYLGVWYKGKALSLE
jgi:hypothetical protein